MDVVDHRQAFPLIHALPVLWRALPRSHDPIRALGCWDGEVLSGVGLGGDGIGFRAGRGRLVLTNKTKKDYVKRKYLEQRREADLDLQLRNDSPLRAKYCPKLSDLQGIPHTDATCIISPVVTYVCAQVPSGDRGDLSARSSRVHSFTCRTLTLI